MAIVLIATLAGVGLVFVAVIAARPVITQISTTTQLSKCEGNLSQIAIAMQQYHQDYGRFPPPYIPDASGKPMHSWRVLLLPYLDRQWQYDQYDFSQPWDSQLNLMLAQQIPSAYVCPKDQTAKFSQETSYMVVVGPQTMFPESGSVSKSQVTDGLAGTILVVEVAETGIGWTQPQDLNARAMTFEVNGGMYGEEVSSFHDGGAVYATADGTTHFLPDNTPPEYVEALTTIRGGELVKPSDMDEFR